jgi:hypothetical protein
VKKNELSMGEAIQQYLEHYRLSGKLTEADLISSWEQIMGASIAKRTSRIYLKKKTLVIHIESSVMRNELSFAKQKIIERVNAHYQRELIEEVLIA